MNYAKIRKMDISNGPGIRVSLFVSGCTHNCKNCFNPETHDFNYGKPFTEKEINKIIELMKEDYIVGLTLLGGEPFEIQNQKGLLPLVKRVKEIYPNKSIWSYSGYLFDKEIIEKMMKENEVTQELLQYIDVIIDGRFIEKLKDPRLKFMGSSNQRIIDVKKSLDTGSVIKINLD